MGKSIKALQDETRAVWFNKLMEFLTATGEDAQQVSSNAWGFYTLDSEGNETAVKITVQIPKGSREGDEFDPVGEAQDFQMKQGRKKPPKQSKRLRRRRRKSRRTKNAARMPPRGRERRRRKGGVIPLFS